VHPGRNEAARHSSAVGIVGQAQRPRPPRLPQGCDDPTAHAQGQPHRGTAAASVAERCHL